ncbi:MAG: glycosyl transferase [Pseudomonadota bacterium]
MSDFHQGGIVTTLHNLTKRPIEEVEKELVEFSDKRRLGLILPSLYSELSTDALPQIINILQKVPYLNQIVIGLDRASEDDYRHALKFFSQLPQPHRVLWNDGPRLQAINDSLHSQELAPTELGKGRNVWYCMGYILASGQADSVALHDCDILTYKRDLLARLIYPVANPHFNYEFCKGYYSRVANGRINGRVSRLFVTPLLRTLKRVMGPSDYIDFMDSFRYPLAGEFSFRTDVMLDIRIPSDWGLEIGVLSEMHRNYAHNRLCQVEIADIYDHKHQELSLEDKKLGLSKMTIDIAKAVFRKMATQGYVFSAETFRTIKATYLRIALDFVETYHNDSRFNGLSHDIHTEELAVEAFAENLFHAGQRYLESPLETPFIPSWNRVSSAMPEVFTRLLQAVEEDNKEFSQ